MSGLHPRYRKSLGSIGVLLVIAAATPALGMARIYDSRARPAPFSDRAGGEHLARVSELRSRAARLSSSKGAGQRWTCGIR